MKKLAFVIMILFTMWSKSVDAQMVTVVEKMRMEYPYIDSVLVIYPNGSVERHEIEYPLNNYEQHYKQLNTIFNGITEQGYKQLESGEPYGYGYTAFLVTYFLKP